MADHRLSSLAGCLCRKSSLTDLDDNLLPPHRRMGMVRHSLRTGVEPPPPVAVPKQLPVPNSDRRACFVSVHNSTLGHMGIDHTLHFLQKRVAGSGSRWPSM